MRGYGKVAMAALAAAMLVPGGTAGAAEPEGGTGAKPPVTEAPKKPADPKAAPAPAAAKPAEAKPAPAAPPAGSSKGTWASVDDFMGRTGKKFEEMRFLGLRPRLSLSETISYTDNAFYQDKNETLVVHRDPDGDNIKAVPNIEEPRGAVSEIVNTASLSLGLEMPLNLALVPILGKDRAAVELVKGSITSVEYLRHGDSPDAWNYEFSVDLPVLLNAALARLMKINAEKSHFWFRAEGDFLRVTDPLDVQVLQYSSVALPNGTFFKSGERNDFERQEWWGKGTLGWKGPKLDALVSFKYLDFDIRDDTTLSSADHQEQTAYGELGYNLGRHRVYGLYEYTNYMFRDRGGPTGLIPSLRDFSRTRAGMGIKGPITSEKLKGKFEVYYLGMDVFDEGVFGDLPFAIFLDTGRVKTGPAGNTVRRPFKEFTGLAGMGEVTYTPYKPTQVTLAYDRNLDWSVVAQHKVVDRGSLSFNHHVNDRLTAMLKYAVTAENVVYREKRLYQEVGAGIRYALFKHTDLDVQYTLRYMRSRREPTTQFADPANEEFLIRPDGDFLANIFSVGVTVSF